MIHDPIDQTCATCIWWNRCGPRLANAERDPSSSARVGTCELHPPAVVSGTHDNFPYTLYPQTHESRTCGSWHGVIDGGDGDGGERVIAFPTANRIAA